MADASQDRPRISKSSFRLIFLSLALSTSLSALDQTIVATALQTIRDDFLDSSFYSWVGGAYLLSSACLTPLYGSLANVLGRKVTILGALTLFALGSIMCGVAPSMLTLVLARAVQGGGGSGMMNMVRIITADLTTVQERGKYLGIVSAAWGISSSLGGIVGGAVVSAVSWRYLFYINVPFCGLTAFIIYRYLDMPPVKHISIAQHLAQFDIIGLILFIGGSAATLFGITLWSRTSTMVTMTCLLGGIIALVAGCIVEVATTKTPIIPPRIFRQRTSAAVMLINMLHGIAFMAGAFYLPVYFQILGHSPYEAGLRTLPYAAGASLSSTLTGFLLLRLPSYRNIMSLCMLVMTMGFASLCFLDTDTATWTQELILFIAAIGVGANWTLPMLILQTTVPKEELSTATAAFGLTRSIASASGVAIGEALYSQAFKSAVQAHSDWTDAMKIRFISTPLYAVRGIAPFSLRDQVRQEHVNAIRKIWVCATPLLCVALLCTFIVPSNAGQEAAEKEPISGSDDQPLLAMSAGDVDLDAPLDNKA